MIPPFNEHGLLPPGIHQARWGDVLDVLGKGAGRRVLLRHFMKAARAFRDAGAPSLYLAGSFVSALAVPGDIDVLWDPRTFDATRLPRVLSDASPVNRTRQKRLFGAEFIPLSVPRDGLPYLDFFQTDKATDRPKGIVQLALDSLPSSIRGTRGEGGT